MDSRWSSEQQAASCGKNKGSKKREASSWKQAASSKHQAAIRRQQTAGSKQQAASNRNVSYEATTPRLHVLAVSLHMRGMV